MYNTTSQMKSKIDLNELIDLWNLQMMEYSKIEYV